MQAIDKQVARRSAPSARSSRSPPVKGCPITGMSSVREAGPARRPARRGTSGSPRACRAPGTEMDLVDRDRRRASAGALPGLVAAAAGRPQSPCSAAAPSAARAGDHIRTCRRSQNNDSHTPEAPERARRVCALVPGVEIADDADRARGPARCRPRVSASASTVARPWCR